MRNWKVTAAFILVIIMGATLLSACGKNSETVPSQTVAESSGTAASNPPTAEEAPTTRIYKDAVGREVEIPVNPQRIVALWTVGEILALGSKPVGSTANLLRFYSEEDQAGIEIVGEGVAGDYEKVLSMEPDLILVYALATSEELEQYGKIAPTVTTPFFGDPYETLRAVADIMDKKDEAERWLAHYETRVLAAREQMKERQIKGETALVIQFALKNIYLYKSSTFPTIYDAYEFVLTDKQKKLEENPEFSSENLSREVLPEFEADHIFIFVNDDESMPILDDLKESAIWKGLTAVKENHVYEISNRISVNDVTTMDWALDEVYRLLNE